MTGLFLDIPQAQRESRRALTQLAEKLAGALGDKALYLAVEAPTWAGKSYEGYDYQALAAAADHLVLRVPSYQHRSGSVPTAPVNPLEEAYYALAYFKGIAKPGKLTLLLDPEISVWSGSSRQTLTDEELAELMTSGERHYSNRYACAYLTKSFAGGKDLVAWYLDRQSMEERVQLAKAFGVGQLCLPGVGRSCPGAGLWKRDENVIRETGSPESFLKTPGFFASWELFHRQTCEIAPHHVEGVIGGQALEQIPAALAGIYPAAENALRGVQADVNNAYGTPRSSGSGPATPVTETPRSAPVIRRTPWAMARAQGSDTGPC